MTIRPIRRIWTISSRDLLSAHILNPENRVNANVQRRAGNYHAKIDLLPAVKHSIQSYLRHRIPEKLGTVTECVAASLGIFDHDLDDPEKYENCSNTEDGAQEMANASRPPLKRSLGQQQQIG
jgi:hypothetical protein